MPYKDPEKKLEAMKRWRGEVMPAGYGKWLYARRKLRFDDAERFRAVLEKIASGYPMTHNEIQRMALAALSESDAAVEALGDWERPVAVEKGK